MCSESRIHRLLYICCISKAPFTQVGFAAAPTRAESVEGYWWLKSDDSESAVVCIFIFFCILSQNNSYEFMSNFSEATNVNNDLESTDTCTIQTFILLTKLDLGALTVCALLLTTTLVLIFSNRRLRKQHNIFPFNLVLADLLGVVTFMVFDSTTLVSGKYVRLTYARSSTLAISDLRKYYITEVKGEVRSWSNLISEERVKFSEQNSENLMKIGWKIRKLWNFEVSLIFRKHFLTSP